MIGIDDVMVTALAKAIASEVGKRTARGGIENVRTALGRDPKQLALKAALEAAFERFESQHPDLPAVYLDQHFFGNRGGKVLAGFLIPGAPPTVDDLVRAWSQQLGDGKVRAPEAVASGAADFLHLFGAELREQDPYREIFNSRAFDRIAESTDEILRELRDFRVKSSTQPPAEDDDQTERAASMAPGVGTHRTRRRAARRRTRPTDPYRPHARKGLRHLPPRARSRPDTTTRAQLIRDYALLRLCSAPQASPRHRRRSRIAQRKLRPALC